MPLFIFKLLTVISSSDNLRSMSTKKKTYEEVKRYTESKGFKLISNCYVNSTSKIQISCPIHGEIETTFKWLRIGFGCKKCGIEHKTAKRRTSIKDVICGSEKMGYSFVSCNYENESSKLILTCPIHGQFNTTWASIKGNHGCTKCGYVRLGEKTRTPFEEIKQKVESLGYELSSKTYESWDQKLLLTCKKHGEFEKTIYSINIGQGCQECGYRASSNKRRKTQKQFNDDARQMGYEVLGSYTGSMGKIKINCVTHGPFTIIAGDLMQGHGCQKCAETYSKPQGELFNFVKDKHSDTLENTRKIIGPLEIDVYIPSLKIGIEYCGLRWHSEQFQKNKNYHYDKMKKCQEKGVHLITIFEDEWLERKDQVKNHLLSVLGKTCIKIGARKTEIREVSKKEALQFLQQTHIQGGIRLEIAFGLYYQSELVGIITGSKHHRQSQDKVFVLNRMSFKHGTSINGGASKLLKRLMSYAKDAGYSKIISWSDNRWSEGNVYNKVGFLLTQELKPDYFYVKNQTRISKQSCQKKDLLKNGGIGNTELEMAKSLGYSRIWDCGKKRWEIIL